MEWKGRVQKRVEESRIGEESRREGKRGGRELKRVESMKDSGIEWNKIGFLRW